MLTDTLKALAREAQLPMHRLGNLAKTQFECPICSYAGPFKDRRTSVGVRLHAQCPKCGALERHRLQYVVLNEVLPLLPTKHMRMLHCSPEHFLRGFFAARFGKYETSDITGSYVDHNADLCALPFPDASYDFVYASHVLEHIPDDRKAIAEIRRILAPGGVAILPVPMVAEHTIEYAAPSPQEAGHVRAPGPDYYDRMRPLFGRVELYEPDDLPEQHQLYLYEDRSRWPAPECPLRRPMYGERHVELVPVCYV